MFNVTWQNVDATSEFWSADLENGTTFNIQPLKPGTNYSICVFAVSTSDPLVKSDVCQYYRTQPSKTIYVHSIHTFFCMT